jgi:hypothetical protein
VPHFARGMVSPLVVTPSSESHASAPNADEVVTLTDYQFQLAKPLTSGTHTFEVRNAASQPHELELIKLAAGKSPKDMLQWLDQPKGPPPGEGVGGAAPFTGGGPVYFTADLTPGNYALICFMPDAKDGKPHFTHGMVKQIHVE